MPHKEILFSHFFYIYLYCRKCNAEFNKLIKAVAHRANFFSKNDKHVWLYFKSFRRFKTLKILGLKVCSLIGYHCTQSSHKMCLTSWWNKESTVLLSKCSWFRAKNIDKIYKIKKFENKMFDRKLIFFLVKKGISKKSKKSKTCRKPEIHNDFPKITKIKWICCLF